MQMTSRDEQMLEWLGVVQMAEMASLRWVLGGFSGAGKPVSLRKAQQWVARCREAGLVDSSRSATSTGSVVWLTRKASGRREPSLVRQTVRHELAVASVAARYVCAGWVWQIDRRLKSDEHQADGMAVRGDAKELVEVELTVKAKERYPRIFASHDERIRFDGITSIVYVTDAPTGQAIVRKIKDQVFRDDRDRFPVLPALDIWGRIQPELWPEGNARFVPLAAGDDDGSREPFPA